MHVVRMRDTPLAVERAIINTASADGHGCRIGLPQDPARQASRRRGICSDSWRIQRRQHEAGAWDKTHSVWTVLGAVSGG